MRCIILARQTVCKSLALVCSNALTYCSHIPGPGHDLCFTIPFVERTAPATPVIVLAGEYARLWPGVPGGYIAANAPGGTGRNTRNRSIGGVLAATAGCQAVY